MWEQEFVIYYFQTFETHNFPADDQSIGTNPGSRFQTNEQSKEQLKLGLPHFK